MVITTPSVYLDHCVIADFTENEKWGDALRKIIQDKDGTLCISALHLIEMSGICPGHTYSRIKDYLASFGRRFAILEYDPNTVSTNERGPLQDRPKASLDFDLARQLVQKWNGLSQITAAILFDILEQNPPLCHALREAHADHKKRLHEDWGKLRSDTQVKKRILDSRCPSPAEAGTIEYLYCEVRKICIRENMNPSDTVDFFHSVVSPCYTDFVVLDKRWAARMRRIPNVPGRLFSTIEYDDFLYALAAS